MELKASELSTLLKGTLRGQDTVLRGAAGLAEATPLDVSFLKDAKSAKTLELYEKTKAGAVLVPTGFDGGGKTVVEVAHPMSAFVEVLNLVEKQGRYRPEGIHPSAVIDPSAKIGKDARIGPNCVVEPGASVGEGACLMAQVYVGARSSVGDGSLIYPQVVLREDVSVGKRCILHSGVVVGADGYGFFFAGDRHNKIPQVGNVVIEDDVELGANTCVDRATTGSTVIGKGTKVDNMVQIAHNVKIGPHCLLVAQVGLGGSSVLGAGVVMAGHSGVADHISIGDGARIGAQTGVLKDVEPGAELFGTPAQPLGAQLRQIFYLRRLPELFKEVKKLRERLEKNA